MQHLFSGFQNVWTAATAARRLRVGKPLGVTIAGERVVFFRDAQGVARALLDVCPHRGVALSGGHVQNGCLRCPFHGWAFDGDGHACDVPYNPDAKRAQLSAVAFPVQEVAGVLWLFTGTHATTALVLPPVLQRSDLHHSVAEIEWKTHWTRAMENMLDWPHLPFVHTKTIGAGMAKSIGDRSRMDIDVDVTDFGARSRIQIDGVAQDGTLDFYKPNAMVLTILESERRTMVNIVAMVPIDRERTNMVMMTSRSFLKLRAFDPLFRFANGRIAFEDKAVVESSFPAEVPDAGDELSVRTDRLPLLFRKYYRSTLRDRLPLLPSTSTAPAPPAAAE
jgi:phenylpropionate dioxygenase-like ring-hydroxylating dioxygenase large terminal subunit